MGLIREEITSSRVRREEWNDWLSWELLASSASHTDVHVSYFASQRKAEVEAERIVGKIATFEGYSHPVATID